MREDSEQEKCFESMLNDLIEMIRTKLGDYFRSEEPTTTNDAIRREQYSTNSSPLSCSVDDEQFMDDLNTDIRNNLIQCLDRSSKNYQEFMLNLLMNFDFDRSKRKFKENLSLNRINSFINLLELIRDSPKGFLSAWNGHLNEMKVYLNKYPSMKDAPGPWQTILIYSAARQNHLELVKYLVEEMQCSINAQNQQHIDKALAKTELNGETFLFDPKSASTELHAACYLGHVEIVKYLIEHDADYYLRNQAFETSLDNIERNQSITRYFEGILNRGFIEEATNLLTESIREIKFENGRKVCVWKYLEFQSFEWEKT